jgi:hypothetical protein
MSASYERQRKTYEALQRAVASLADTLEKSMPDLPEPSSVTRTRDGGIIVLTGRVSFSSLQLSLQLDSRFAYLTQVKAMIIPLSQTLQLETVSIAC